MILLDSGRGPLAGLPAEIVRRRRQFVLHAGVHQHQLIALRIEGEILVFQRLAVQANQTARLAEAGSELVHNAAVHAAVIVLGALSDLRQFKLVDVVAERIVQGKGEAALEGGGRRKTRAEGNVTRKNGIESLHGTAALDRLAAHAEDVAGPRLCGLVLLVQAKDGFLVVIEGESAHLVRSIEFERRHNTFVDGAGEHIAAVIVGMFADKVDTARRCIQRCARPVEGFEFFQNFCFHIVKF